MNPTFINLYVVNATANSDLRDMSVDERRRVEERRLITARELLPGTNVLTNVTINANLHTAIMVPRLTRREVADAWYTLTTVFGDFNPDRVMFEKIEIEV